MTCQMAGHFLFVRGSGRPPLQREAARPEPWRRDWKGLPLGEGKQMRCFRYTSRRRSFCLRQPYSFCASKKNMESRGVKKMCRWHIFSQDRSGYAARREVIKTDLFPPLWNLPQCGDKNGAVPHNQNLNLSVHPSTSAWPLLPRGACSAPRGFSLVMFLRRTFKASLEKGGAERM